MKMPVGAARRVAMDTSFLVLDHCLQAQPTLSLTSVASSLSDG